MNAGPETQPDDLGAAWAAAEAALPEGWNLRGVERDLWGLTHQPREDRWFATAARGIETDRPDYIESDLCLTPAAALRALAARFRTLTRADAGEGAGK